MRDEATANQILAGFRTGLIYKLTNAQAMLNKMGSLPSLMKQEDINEVVRKHLEFTAKLTIGVYSDILAIFDLIDVIGKNSIQSNFDNNKIMEALSASQSDSRVIEWVERRLVSSPKVRKNEFSWIEIYMAFNCSRRLFDRSILIGCFLVSSYQTGQILIYRGLFFDCNPPKHQRLKIDIFKATNRDW
jgi:hypothetical protein